MSCFGHGHGVEMTGDEKRSLSLSLWKKLELQKNQCYVQPRGDSQQAEHHSKEETSGGSGTEKIGEDSGKIEEIRQRVSGQRTGVQSCCLGFRDKRRKGSNLGRFAMSKRVFSWSNWNPRQDA